MAMFGPKYSSLFTSRWMAIAWCILICLSAIGFVGAGSDDETPANAANAVVSGAAGSVDLD